MNNNTLRKPPSVIIPPDWKEYQSKSFPGKKYYFNSKTGGTVWNLEEILPAGLGPGPGTPPLDVGRSGGEEPRVGDQAGQDNMRQKNVKPVTEPVGYLPEMPFYSSFNATRPGSMEMLPSPLSSLKYDVPPPRIGSHIPPLMQYPPIFPTPDFPVPSMSILPPYMSMSSGPASEYMSKYDQDPEQLRRERMLEVERLERIIEMKKQQSPQRSESSEGSSGSAVQSVSHSGSNRRSSATEADWPEGDNIDNILGRGRRQVPSTGVSEARIDTGTRRSGYSISTNFDVEGRRHTYYSSGNHAEGLKRKMPIESNLGGGNNEIKYNKTQESSGDDDRLNRGVPLDKSPPPPPTPTSESDSDDDDKSWKRRKGSRH